ncbi:hypothetical protein Q7P37_000747 [Cladosporium fusiforme]
MIYERRRYDDLLSSKSPALYIHSGQNSQPAAAAPGLRKSRDSREAADAMKFMFFDFDANQGAIASEIRAPALLETSAA